MAPHQIPILTFIGQSGCGKTTLIEKLIRELSLRGYRLAAVKHHSHAGFDIDKEGKDSWKFAQAGCRQVVIASPDKFATYRKLERELSLDEVVAEIHDVDLIVVEGYRSSNQPAIEVVRAESGFELVGTPEQRIAVVADAAIQIGVPFFHIDNVQEIAGWIVERYLAENRLAST